MIRSLPPVVTRFTRIVFLILLIVCVTFTAFAKKGNIMAPFSGTYPYSTIYVDANIATGGDGGTWATAFKTLSDALAAVQANKNINIVLVAAGTYYPAGLQNSTNRDTAFTILRGGLKIYGGYPSGGGVRNAFGNKTILNGDIGTAQNISDNSYHVLVVAGISAADDSLIIDGLTITNGAALGNGAYTYGNTSIYQGNGGGIYIINNGNKIVLNNLHVGYNSCVNAGGSIDINKSQVLLSNSAVRGTVSYNIAGGMFVENGATVTAINTVFTGNSSVTSGGGVYNSYSTASYINCTFYNNESSANPFGAAVSSIYSDNSAGQVANCIVWDAYSSNAHIINTNSTLNFSHNIVKDGDAGGLNADPGFLYATSSDPEGGDGIWGTSDDYLQPKAGSPAIDAGDNSVLPAWDLYEITGAARKINFTVNIGAYESEFIYTALYVDSSIATPGDGRSWATAYKTMSNAVATLKAAGKVSTVYVAKGTYYPTGSQNATNRDSAFTILRGGLKIYGGYPAGGGVRSVVDNPTILSGDIGATNNTADNSYHVVTITGIPATQDSLVLDGFTITNGNASGTVAHTYNGTAMYQGNGGGVYLIGNANKIAFNALVISKNSASNAGGGIDVNGSQPVIRNAVFTGNISGSIGGGLFTEVGANTTVVNAVFTGNQSNNGGAVYNSQCSTSVINCTMYGNIAGFAAGMYNNTVTGQVANCILWDASPAMWNVSSPVTLSNNIITAGSYGGNNADPLFVNAANPAGPDNLWGTRDDGLQTKTGSPAIDAGSNSAVPAWVNADIKATQRILNGTVNIGAYESGGQYATVYVDSSIAVSGDGGTWATAYKTVSEAVAMAQDVTAVDTILVAKGTYYPTGSAGSTKKDSAFVILRGGLKIYGGYPSGGGKRNTALNPTILSGDIGRAGDSTDNSYHVMVIANIPAAHDSLVLDGLTVTRGNAASQTGYTYGGTALAQTNGAGIYMFNNGNKILLNNIIVSNNYTGNAGGGIDVNNSSPVITNSVFANNTGINGIALFNEQGARTTVVNTLFTGNKGSANGIIYNSSCAPSFINCTIYGNAASIGHGMFNQNSTVQVTNCIIWGNTTTGVQPAIYSQGGSLTFTSNITQDNNNPDPLFINAANPAGTDGIWATADDGLQPGQGSPAIDAGINSAVQPYTGIDITGKTRITNNIVNIGAYESGFLYRKIYVDSSIAASGYGTTWATAFKTMAEATAFINATNAVDTILVAKGTYYPTGSQSSTNRDSAFTILRGGLKIYGGYPAGGGIRNPKANATILSGDIGTPGSNGDNSYHVVVITGIPASADTLVMDGFTITNGNANGSGGGAYGASRYNGAGLYLLFDSTVVLNNLIVSNNTAAGASNIGGGGIYVGGSSAIISNSVITANACGTNGGGLFYSGTGTKITVVNTLFFGNQANTVGGAVYGFIAAALFSNCTFYGNNAYYGAGGMFNWTVAGQVNNCILWGNGNNVILRNSGPVFNNNIIQNGEFGGNPGNPLFADSTQPAGPDGTWGTADDGLQPGVGSPAVDAGDNSALPAWAMYDITGAKRIQNHIVNMGAYECGYQYTKIYVDSSVAISGGGGSWAKAFKTLADAITTAREITSVDSILVAKGTYYPTGSQNSTNRDSAFVILHDGLKIYGGYPAGGGIRNPKANATILSGDIGTPGSNGDNSYHVVVITGVPASADTLVMDGFTITNGNANGTGSSAYGAYSAPRYNGAGLYLLFDSTGVFNNLIVSNNTAAGSSSIGGGGIYVGASSAIISNSVITANACGTNGGGLYYTGNGTKITVVNTLFVGNQANTLGGAVYGFNAAALFSNCTLYGNNAEAGTGGMYNWTVTGRVGNCILWGNGTNVGLRASGPVFSNNIIQNGESGGNPGNPLFADSTQPAGADGTWGTADDGLRPQPGSPAINAGDNNTLPAWLTQDITGSERVTGAIVDIGAYEALAPFTWTGAVDNDWNNPGNWSNNTVPGAADDVTIPALLDNGPNIMADAYAHNITNNGFVIQQPGATLSITGNLVSTDRFWASGIVLFNGTEPQTISGDVKLFNVTINNTAGVTLLSGTTSVNGTYTPQAGVLTTNGHLVLTSDFFSTAYVAAGTGNYINGAVTVERYLPGFHRAWNLLTAPLSNTGSIFNNWQNAGVTDGATGVEMFSPAGTGPTGNGLTRAGVASSITTYNSQTDSWVDVANTTSTGLSGNSSSAANNVYGLFVTGPYGSGNIKSGVEATTLRATGLLQMGAQSFNYNNVDSGRYLLIGNPYAAPVDFVTMQKNNVANNVWIWDADRTDASLGGYVTFSYDTVTGTYDQDIPYPVTQQTTVIQSGQAFFVQSLGGSQPAGVTIHETDKIYSSQGYNGGGFSASDGNAAQQMRITLNKNASVADGILVKFGDSYSSFLKDDVNKMFNYNENLSVRVDTNYLSIERMPMPKENDSLWLDVYGLKAKTSYSFTVTPQNIPVKVKACLLDRFLNTKTQIDLTTTSEIAYTTTGDKASYAEDRFVIVFAQAGALASSGTTAKVSQQDNAVQVQWTTIAEQDVQYYVVERCADGHSFMVIQSNIQPRNSNKTEVYNITDMQPSAGNNYYRIQIITKDGSIHYSNVVNVTITKGKAVVNVYPNPVVKTEQLHVTMKNMDAGKYSLQVFSSDGRLVLQRSVKYNGTVATLHISLPASIAAGSYTLVLLDEKGNTWKQQVIIQ